MAGLIDRHDVLDNVPEGWRVLVGACNTPPGYVWIDNCKSRFGNDRKVAFVPEEVAWESIRGKTNESEKLRH